MTRVTIRKLQLSLEQLGELSRGIQGGFSRKNFYQWFEQSMDIEVEGLIDLDQTYPQSLWELLKENNKAERDRMLLERLIGDEEKVAPSLRELAQSLLERSSHNSRDKPASPPADNEHSIEITLRPQEHSVEWLMKQLERHLGIEIFVQDNIEGKVSGELTLRLSFAAGSAKDTIARLNFDSSSVPGWVQASGLQSVRVGAYLVEYAAASLSSSPLSSPKTVNTPMTQVITAQAEVWAIEPSFFIDGNARFKVRWRSTEDAILKVSLKKPFGTVSLDGTHFSDVLSYPLPNSNDVWRAPRNIVLRVSRPSGTLPKTCTFVFQLGQTSSQIPLTVGALQPIESGLVLKRATLQKVERVSSDKARVNVTLNCNVSGTQKHPVKVFHSKDFKVSLTPSIVQAPVGNTGLLFTVDVKRKDGNTSAACSLGFRGAEKTLTHWIIFPWPSS